jgi:Lrp/AsnC ligand binding domain
VIVHVVARDTAHLKDLALDKFTNRPGVTRIETAIVYDKRRQHEIPLIRSGQSISRGSPSNIITAYICSRLKTLS